MENKNDNNNGDSNDICFRTLKGGWGVGEDSFQKRATIVSKLLLSSKMSWQSNLQRDFYSFLRDIAEAPKASASIWWIWQCFIHWFNWTTRVILYCKLSFKKITPSKSYFRLEGAPTFKSRGFTPRFLVDVSDILYFFRLGEGSPRRQEGGRFIENSRKGRGLPGEGARDRGAGRVSAVDLAGGGGEFFFRGRPSHQGFGSCAVPSRSGCY